MLIVTAIIGILSLIVLVSHSAFNQTIVLSHTATDVALSIRDAQTYGIGSQVAGGSQNLPYGIEFMGPTSFTMFQDSYPSVAANATPDKQPGDGQYDPPPRDAIKLTTNINNSTVISDWCGTDSAAPANSYCLSTGAIRMDIVFSRPNTAANISVCTSGGCVGVGNWKTKLDTACITLSSRDGVSSRYIRVSQIGQIGSAPSCP